MMAPTELAMASERIDEDCAAGANITASRTSPPPTASPSRSNPTSMTDLAARFSAAGIGV
jgi:hypothetical protein